MPVQQQSGNGHPTKPLMPALSSRFRAAKSPVTPKVAGSTPTSPILSHLSTGHDLRPNIASLAREGTPPLSANITPRSGNRRSRIGTDSPASPSAMSAGAKRSRAVSGSKAAGDEAVMNGAGLWINSPNVRPYTAARLLQNNVNSLSSPNLGRKVATAKSGIGSEDSPAASQFFHADDAKSSISACDAPERPSIGPKAANFFYVGSGNTTASPDPARSNSGSPGPDSSKFFHANDLPEPYPKAQPIKPILNKKKSTASIRSPRLQSPEVQRKLIGPSRPTSPLKETSYRSAPPILSSPPKNRPAAAPVLTARLDAARRTSVGSDTSTPRQTLHKKSSSINMPNAATCKTPVSPKPKQISLPEAPISPKPSQRQRISKDMTSPDSASPRSTSLTSIETLPTSASVATRPLSGNTDITSPTLIPQRPVEGAKSPPTPAQEAATNARRERKVLDLEISNSSLLAINRTLEREMRKQSAELRRFRRLSRSGRLSIRTTSGQSKSSLGALAEEDDMDDDEAKDLLDGLDEMDLGESDDASASDEDSNFSPAASDSASNLSSMHAMKQRRRDEKRLMLDLSKHRQLLIDSEKMNSSIRRCLAWSDEMIKEGNKALEYHVKVGDVQLGGRILEQDEDESEEERRMGLVSPSRAIGAMEADRLWKDARNEAMSPVLGAADPPDAVDEL